MTSRLGSLAGRDFARANLTTSGSGDEAVKRNDRRRAGRAADLSRLDQAMRNSSEYSATVENFSFRDLAEELGALSSALGSGLLSESEKKEYSKKKLIVMTEISKRLGD